MGCIAFSETNLLALNVHLYCSILFGGSPMPASLPRHVSFKPAHQFLYLTLLLSALVIMSACGSSKASSLMNPTANTAATNAQPTQSAPSSNLGSGQGGTGNSKPEAMFVGDYVPEDPAPSGVITSYDVNLTNGAVNHVNNAFDNGTEAMAVNPAGTLLYVTEIGPTMAAYSIAPNGAISFKFDTVTIRAHSFTEGLAVHPNNQFVYAGAYTEGIIGYHANPDGTMTELSGNPFKPESYVAGIEPSGKWLYGVATTPNGMGLVIPFKINATTGALTAPLVIAIKTPNHQFAIGDARLDSQGKFLFVTDQANNAIYTFLLNARTGNAQQVGTTSTGSETPGFITVTPSDSFVYVGSSTQPDILGYSLSQGGTLSPINGGKPFTLQAPNSGGIRGVKADLSGHFLYANTVFYTNGLSIDPTTGELKSVMSPMFDSNELTDIAFAPLP